uniref:basic immunoglobulin-like variable motif-containing protein n=1 Tax=Oncorhynchus gorbuscha TaxID=8017 RepID=UPI001EAEC5CC|nr:basic immunoglobulin-like variable motif-containing protein [Oncorhynchus gorbuscha]XP_046196927.1 basic immunoglobulin-like variable motif-containing protein [Oncorhynchus gorbuscha]
MPNSGDSSGPNVSGSEPGDQAMPLSQRPPPPDREDDQRGLLTTLTRDSLRTRRASSAELQLPWTCPVTHSREKFYTVCSDYALLNQAASLYRLPSTPREVAHSKQDGSGTPLVKSNTVDLSQGQGQPAGVEEASDEDFDMEGVSCSNTKPILAWEIDTTNFDAVLTRKPRTSKQNQ